MKRPLALFAVLLVLVFVLPGCAGVEVRAEGCYYEPPYGRVCVSAVRYPDGRIVVDIKTDVGTPSTLPADVRARALDYGASLIVDPPGD